MHLKKVIMVFIGAVLLFALLTAWKTGAFNRFKPMIKNYITGLFQNNPKNKAVILQSIPKIETELTNCLTGLETPLSEITILHLLEDSTIEIKAPVPKGKPMEWIIWQLTASAKSAGYQTADCFYEELPFSCTIQFKNTRKAWPYVKLTILQGKKYLSSAAKMAIVIADFGFQANPATMQCFSFPEPITLSFVSSRKMSASTATIAQEHHKEIILLLPMEPLTASYRQFAAETILLDHSEERIREIISTSAALIPFYSGFSNLCGSRILDDSLVMRTILTEVKKKNGYFLIASDSRRSKATTIALELEVPIRAIDIALDSSTCNGTALPDTLRHAAMIAQKTGSVIVSGRATDRFITAIKEQLPYFQQNGIELVPVSEIVQKGK